MTIFGLGKAAPWQVLAACQLAEGIQGGLAVAANAPALSLSLAGHYLSVGDTTPLALDIVPEGEESYLDALAREAGVPNPNNAPVFEEFPFPVRLQCYAEPLVVLAPYSHVQEIVLPVGVWTQIIRLLRMHAVRVVLAGEGTRMRMDEAAFHEPEYLRQEEFGAVVQKAALVVGVPHVTTMLAGLIGTPLITLYPSDLPLERWLWHAMLGQRILYEHGKPQHLPIILQVMRDMLKHYAGERVPTT